MLLLLSISIIMGFIIGVRRILYVDRLIRIRQARAMRRIRRLSKHYVS